MLKIGSFSKLGKTTVKTLHHYDEVGLLKPAFIDAETGYRYYESAQLHRLYEIGQLRQIGFSIAEISLLLGGRKREEILQAKLAELQEQQLDAENRLLRLNYLLEKRKEVHPMEYSPLIKEIPACTVFAYRTTLPTYADIFGMVHTVQEKLKRTNPGVSYVQPDYCFNVYWDGEYREQDIDMEFCQAVTAPGKDAEGICFKNLPAIKAAAVLHKGPYEKLGAAYAAIFSWLEANGYKAEGNPRESYIEGIWNTENPEEWLTEIQVPIK